QIRGKFSQELPASPTRHDRFNRVRNHSDRDKLALSRRDCTTHRHSLGANRQPIGDIFDVAADENGPRFTLNGCSYGKSRITAHKLAGALLRRCELNHKFAYSFVDQIITFHYFGEHAAQSDPLTPRSPGK